ncbi:hypothetical protein FB451DRAFT_1435498 [Mycena latifolia]|nr:hypothetical protein FB451DRAFT_1435498 [Mycena latifolia]
MMASGSRKQITYAHKRNRNKRTEATSASSPLEEIDDPDRYMSHAELSRRLLKRARRSFNHEVPSSKKLKSSAGSPAASPPRDTSNLSELSVEQMLKVNSSSANPNQFSPLPLARRVISRTASGSLKENASPPMHRKSKDLGSPFNSHPSSTTSPHKVPPARLSSNAPEHSIQKSFKRAPSDINYNPNVPQSAAATNSPRHTHSPARMRRPSAPSPPRPNHWIPNPFTFNFPTTHTNPFSLPSTSNAVDSNPPPLAFSFYDDLESRFFDDAQGSSTPAKKQRAYTLRPAVADDDKEHHEPDLTITQDAMDVDLAPTGMKVLPMRERSPWLSDSLISAPASQDWKRPPQESVYTHSPPKDAAQFDDISLGLGLAAFVAGVEPPSHANEHNAGNLKNVFDGLALGDPSLFAIPSVYRRLNNHTSSLDSPLTAAPAADKIHPKPNGRERRGTSRALDFPENTTALPKRTRSGTVVGRLDGPGIDQANGLPIASHGMPSAPPSSPDELDAFSSGSGSRLTTFLVLRPKKQGGKKRKAEQVVMDDEDEDELLLKPGSNVLG